MRLTSYLFLLIFTFLFFTSFASSSYDVGSIVQNALDNPIETTYNEENFTDFSDQLDIFNEDLDLESEDGFGVIVNTDTNLNVNDEISLKASNDKPTESKKFSLRIEEKKDKSLIEKIKEYFVELKIGLTGNAILEESLSDLSLPDIPSEPIEAERVMYPADNEKKIISFLTGNAIIGFPDWAYDGDKQDKFTVDIKYSIDPRVPEAHHFDITYDTKLDEDAGETRGVVYNTGYYLNEKEGKWIPFRLDGTQIRASDWLISQIYGLSAKNNPVKSSFPTKAAITISDYSDKPYAVFLFYSCIKNENNSPWKCNNGKWVLKVVETGRVNYQVLDQDVGPVQIENTDLNLDDIPSLMEQLGIEGSIPRLDDLVIVPKYLAYEYNLGDIGDIEFYIINLGNKNSEDIQYEIDIGEKALVDIVANDLPKRLDVGEIKEGKVYMKFKEEGDFKFPVSVIPSKQEVDSTDNFLTFNVTVLGSSGSSTGSSGSSTGSSGSSTGSSGSSQQIDSNDEEWNREINYVIAEAYTKENINSGEEPKLYVSSGTDKIRTVFGDFKGKSVGETLKLHFEPIVYSEAIARTNFFSAIHLGIEQLYGDREIINYYVKITNMNTGQTYVTPAMESNYKYFYNPKELIPNFEYCTGVYSAEYILTNNPNDEILFSQPSNKFSVKNDSCATSSSLAPEIEYEKKRPVFPMIHRIVKDDGEYLLPIFTASRGKLGKSIEESGYSYTFDLIALKGDGKKYSMNITPGNPKLYNSQEIFGRDIDYEDGEEFKIVAKYDQRLKEAFEKFGFVSNDGFLRLKNGETKIILDGNYGVMSRKSTDWATFIFANWKLYYRNYYYGNVPSEVYNDTKLDIIIKDVTDGEEYRIKDVPLRNLTGGKRDIEYKRPAEIDKIYGVDLTRYDEYGVINWMDPDRIDELPEFKNNHYYLISLEVMSPDKITYQIKGEALIYYVDGYQFIRNKPLARTRFLNLQNTPASVMSRVISGVPLLTVDYEPANLFYDGAEKIVKKTDINQREIIGAELFPISKMDNNNTNYERYVSTYTFPRGVKIDNMYERNENYLNYLNDGEYIYPVYDELTIRLVPFDYLEVKDGAASDEYLNTLVGKRFNCKIGRYDMICSRRNDGYIITYLDQANRMLYEITMKVPQVTNQKFKYLPIQLDVALKALKDRQESIFIKQTRDNSSIYDSAVYDILSEIDRNPIKDFNINEIYEKKEISRPDYLSILFQPIKYDGAIRDPESENDYPLISLYGNEAQLLYPEDRDFPESPKWENGRYDKESGILYLDTKGSAENLIYIYKMQAEVKDELSKKVIAEKSFNFEKDITKTQKLNDKRTYKETKGLALSLANREISKWFDKLDLVEGNEYSVHLKITEASKDMKFGSWPIRFTYRKNYERFILEENSEYVRKIPGINSKILMLTKEPQNLGKDQVSKVFDFIYSSPQTKLYNTVQSQESSSRGPIFRATFVINNNQSNQDIKFISEEENLTDVNMAYELNVFKLNNVYDWYLSAPSNELNSLDTDLKGIVCSGSRDLRGSLSTYSMYSRGQSLFFLLCRWSNFENLETYVLQLNFLVNGATEVSKTNGVTWLSKEKQKEVREFSEKILDGYLKLYPPTPILNTTFQTYY